MKVDLEKLAAMRGEKRPKPYRSLVMKSACFAVCLAALGAGTLYQSMDARDSVSADALYDESEANPSFTVQHVGDVSKVDIQPGEGQVTVLMSDGAAHHASLLDDGTFATVTRRANLYESYTARWQDMSSISDMSFLNGADGSQAEGYILKEIWFGKNPSSLHQSDFLVAEVPAVDGRADLSRITLTNNPEKEGLSLAEGGYYKPDEDGKYTICVQNGDVIRLVFDVTDNDRYAKVNVFDYDVSDGGYYKEDDYFHKGNRRPTSGQASEKGVLYVDAIGKGIHVPENYPGYVDGSGSNTVSRLGFGGGDIGSDLENESITGEVNTLNVWNYDQLPLTCGTGAALGLTKGVSADGDLIWSDAISAPDLFGSGELIGKTNYLDNGYAFSFKQDGFSRTLSSVLSMHDGGLQGLESLKDVGGNLTNSFWMMDGAPSYGTDGHDPVWGSGSEDIQYYKSKDRSPQPFKPSDDGLDHNSFFGFSYTEDFILSPGYVGALDFFGYSDDDLWVYAGQVDEEGKVIPETVVQAADLGGVHDSAAWYCNLWDVIDKVPYNSDAQHWRLFVFWLERDGLESSCYLRLNLPEAPIWDARHLKPVTIQAANQGIATGNDRTFLMDATEGNLYTGTYDDGSGVVVRPNVPFTIPDGHMMVLGGFKDGESFTVTEINVSKSFAEKDGKYIDSSSFVGTVGRDNAVALLSVTESGMLSITADADGAPEEGHHLSITFGGLPDVMVPAMDGNGGPVNSRFTDEAGRMEVIMSAGETLLLYGLPEGTEYTIEHKDSPGWHVDGATVSGGDAIKDTWDVSGVLGAEPSEVVFSYRKNDRQEPSIAIEQSISGDWGTEDVTVDDKSLLSYRITVTNPNEEAASLTIEDMLPEGLMLSEGTLMDGGVLDGRTIRWEVDVEPFSSKELSFTCKVDAEGPCTFTNNAWIVEGDENICSTVTLTASMP